MWIFNWLSMKCAISLKQKTWNKNYNSNEGGRGIVCLRGGFFLFLLLCHVCANCAETGKTTMNIHQKLKDFNQIYTWFLLLTKLNLNRSRYLNWIYTYNIEEYGIEFEKESYLNNKTYRPQREMEYTKKRTHEHKKTLTHNLYRFLI